MTDTPTPTTMPATVPATVLPQAITGMTGSDAALLAEIERRLVTWDSRRSLVLRVLNSTDVVRMGSRLAKNRPAWPLMSRIIGSSPRVTTR